MKDRTRQNIIRGNWYADGVMEVILRDVPTGGVWPQEGSPAWKALNVSVLSSADCDDLACIIAARVARRDGVVTQVDLPTELHFYGRLMQFRRFYPQGAEVLFELIDRPHYYNRVCGHYDVNMDIIGSTMRFAQGQWGPNG